MQEMLSLQKYLRRKIAEYRKGVSHIDINKKPLFDINKISNMLPHRYPFLLVDKIMEIGDDYIVGVEECNHE